MIGSKASNESWSSLSWKMHIWIHTNTCMFAFTWIVTEPLTSIQGTRSRTWIRGCTNLEGKGWKQVKHVPATATALLLSPDLFLLPELFPLLSGFYPILQSPSLSESLSQPVLSTDISPLSPSKQLISTAILVLNHTFSLDVCLQTCVCVACTTRLQVTWQQHNLSHFLVYSTRTNHVENY